MLTIPASLVRVSVRRDGVVCEKERGMLWVLSLCKVVA